MVLDRAVYASSIVLMLTAPSFAATQVSNLSEPLSVLFNANGTNFAHASSFTTDASSYWLEGVTVSVSTNSSGTSELQLRSDAAGSPGAVIENLGSQSLPSIQGQVLLTYASAGITLAANTTYWVTLGETGSGDFSWGGTTSTSESSPGSWTIGDQTWYRNAGTSTWLPTSFGPPNESALFSVDASELIVPSMSWVTVGNPGNACDPQVDGCFGAVAYEYSISKYEVTNSQYVEFLNAVAATDSTGLYNTDMMFDITRSGSSGSYSYSVVSGREQLPVASPSFFDALRFANWMHNGKPTGAQDDTTTEDGAYTFTGPTTVGARNPGATVALPTEDEWYKAAYYDAAAVPPAYLDYPAGSNTQPTCALPTGIPNHANCQTAVGDFTDVGSYPGSPSPYGTFDQGGNVWERNEAIIGSERGVRGGCQGAFTPAITLAAASRFSVDPALEGIPVNLVGFRVVPEPGALLQLASGISALLYLAKRRQPARS